MTCCIACSVAPSGRDHGGRPPSWDSNGWRDSFPAHSCRAQLRPDQRCACSRRKSSERQCRWNFCKLQGSCWDSNGCSSRTSHPKSRIHLGLRFSGPWSGTRKSLTTRRPEKKFSKKFFFFQKFFFVEEYYSNAAL